MDSPVVAGAETAAETAADTAAASEAGAPRLPDISDYWPDAPQRLGPPADHYELPGADPDRTTPAWHNLAGPDPAGPPAGGYRPATGRTTARDRATVDRATVDRATVEIPVGVRPHRSFWRSAVVLATLLGVGGTLAWAIARPDPEPPGPPTFAGGAASPVPSAAVTNPPVAIGTPPPSRPAPPPVVPAAATFEFVDNTTELNVTIGEVAGGWFRVTSPRGSGVVPSTEVDGTTLRVGIEPTGTRGSARVDVLLSEEVDWTVRTRGGFRTAALDLKDGTVDRVDLLGGIGRLDLTLPRQRAALPIVLAGGVERWRITTAGEVPVRAAFRRGAGTVTVYGDRDRGVRRGDELTVGAGSGGLDLNAEEGVGTLTVSAR
ncbi:hypothetical protein [Actinoplanes aureus]|uniref:Uncharacterized protein n=1 Tax=Actinoplanes aureus TaxID=2792083 RepID=A0A931C7A7_9ACTN|nr:hypothetical protein [Actinoplanes aureus]MBG0562697.1 hypothetical protein [Actinoplanes aureus]